MRILIWAGYRFERWNGSSKEGLGGTETAILEIAERLVTYGHDVTVAGEVHSTKQDPKDLSNFNSDRRGKINGVTWLATEDFEIRIQYKDWDYYDVVIGVNYLHFLNYCEDVGIDPKHKWFWMHNTDYEPYYKHEPLENTSEIFDKIQLIVTPSPWAGYRIMDDIITPVANENGGWKGSVQSITNGINIEDFFYDTKDKDPNKFIWSSAVDRNLTHLLDNWHKIKEIMPEATLDVYYPKYSNPHNWEDQTWFNYEGVVDKMNALYDDGVRDMGSVSKEELYAAMAKASYWMYLTHYEETFCITALEMQMSEVLCITSDQAALRDTVKSGIIIPTTDHDTMFNEAIKTLHNLQDHPDLKAIVLADGREEAKEKTWDIAASAWHDALMNAEEYKSIKNEGSSKKKV